ncbi:hypothetical protein [Comamonas sp.]|uniref:hypothetical protein n=1 Tax=Comamonas sp. TaxID=34028 RepID=UPI002896ABC1|nr:hypothetical protein [Comamonas sp.]
MPRTVSLGAILGLNNRLPPTRMEVALPNRTTAAWLQVAKNIDLTSNGFIRRRRGAAAKLVGNCHSVWADKADAYMVREGDLVHLNVRSLAQTTVQAGVGQAPLQYVRLPDGMVYWTNGNQIGRLAGASARSIATPVPNPVPVASATGGSLPPGRYQVLFTALGPDGESPTTEPQSIHLPNGGGVAIAGLTPNTLVYATGPDGEIFNEIAPGDYLSLGNTGAACGTLMHKTMPAGRAIAHYRGSLMMGRGRFVYVSEPYEYGQVNLGRAFIPFPGEVSVIAPCEDGVYICADKTYWIAGDPLNSAPVVVLPFGAMPGSLAYDPKEQASYWQSELGVIVAKPGGIVVAPQDDALQFGRAESGATLVRDQDGETHIIAARFDVEELRED